MQTMYKIEYIVYNRFDVISMLELDLKTLDLSFTLPSMSGCSDFKDFESQPKLIADAMYYFAKNEGCIVGTAPMSPKKGVLETESDDVIEAPDIPDTALSLAGWVVTLPAHMTAPNGLRCIEEDPNIVTNIRGHGMDSDCTSSYPSDILALNVSKETCKREIIWINGIEEYNFRMANINFMSGKVNAVEYCTTMFGFPTLNELEKMYLKEKENIL